MTEGHRATPSVRTAKFAIAALAIAGGLLTTAGHAVADPAPNPAPADPAAVAPGQPVALPAGPEAPAPPAPPPAGPPSVPEIANPVYGSGKSGSGPLGTLRDLWHQAQNPYDLEGLAGADGIAAPPPGAGPPPALPPGYVSMNAPGSETPMPEPEPGAAPVGPALPPGYYPLNGPPPPGYEFQPINAAAPAAPPPAAPMP